MATLGCTNGQIIVRGASAWTCTNQATWSLTGNSGTNPATNFLGTIDNAPLTLRTNNVERVRITADGKVGIGTNNPRSTLEVNGLIASGVQQVNAPNTTVTNSYVSLFSGNAILPRAQDNPGAFVFIRNVNNTGTINVSIAAGGGEFFDASAISGFATYGMNANTTGKSLMIVSDGNNWTVFRPTN